MILVDTSVWIELLSSRRKRVVPEKQLLVFATCGPIIQEVLQGLRPGPQSESFREAFLAIPVLTNPIPLSLYMAAADIYAQGRMRGLTIRSSVDCLIAAIAIENRVPVWHRDRDFDKLAQFTPLKVARLR
jgi:predicted nucleic acid-binding protein